jgi:hypothetical protein
MVSLPCGLVENDNVHEGCLKRSVVSDFGDLLKRFQGKIMDLQRVHGMYNSS